MIFKSKSNFSLCSLYFHEVCNDFAGPISASLHPGNTAPFFKKCCSGGEPLATLCPMWPARDLNLRPPAPETNALRLDQRLAIFMPRFRLFINCVQDSHWTDTPAYRNWEGRHLVRIVFARTPGQYFNQVWLASVQIRLNLWRYCNFLTAFDIFLTLMN